MRPLAELKNVSVFIPGARERKLVLRDVSLTLYPGARHAIFGVNGSGKSTFLRLIAGQERACAGSIFWRDGEELSASPIIGRKICALVSPATQERAQRRPLWIKTKDYLADGEPYLEETDLADMADKYLGELSQGQLRAVLLIKALLARPEILLLDEWSQGLDKKRVAKFARLIDALNACVVYAGHNGAEINPNCVVWRMDMGRLTPGEAPTLRRAQVSLAASAPAEGAVIFSLREASVYKERKLILKNINWRWRAGEHWFVYGANGSGKSTFLRALAGDEFVAAGGGREFFSLKSGKRINSLADLKKLAPLVSDLGQAEYGYPLSALEFVLSGYDNVIGVYREYGAWERERAEKIINELFPENKTIAEISIRRLSFGQLRRLWLARALIGDPEVLLLDEPFSGLDDASRERFMNALVALARKGVGLIMVSHDDRDRPPVFNRFAYMENGRLIVRE